MEFGPMPWRVEERLKQPFCEVENNCFPGNDDSEFDFHSQSLLLLVFLWAIPGIFFVFSNEHYNFCNKQTWKNVHLPYDPGIQTHDLWNMSLLP